MKKVKLSVVLATRNEEKNIAGCLRSVKNLADEIVVVDESSKDKTRDIAKKLGAKIYKVKHESIFHKTKQKALDYAMGNWILQLDADERVNLSLATEIKKVLKMKNVDLLDRRPKDRRKWRIFQKHQRLIEQRDGSIGRKTGEVVAFFIPRVNYFLSSPLKYAGVYPDGVIRLVKKGKARFPAKSVHELMEIDGQVAWLFSDLEHRDSPTLERYLDRANRYTDLTAEGFKKEKIPVNYWNLFKYSFPIPFVKFLSLYIRHEGFLDGMRGFIWSAFSALHHPIAYFKYWTEFKNSTKRNQGKRTNGVK